MSNGDTMSNDEILMNYANELIEKEDRLNQELTDKKSVYVRKKKLFNFKLYIYIDIIISIISSYICYI